ncbi:MAG: ATP-binding cassette domain-containing protein [Alphaproteobacteria bacterium]
MTAEPAPLVEGRCLSLRLGGRDVLSNVDVAVRAGEIVTLIGPNGAGKTMLVRVLLGLVTPDSGTVRRRPELVVGYVPQRFDLDPVVPLSVRGLLGLTRKLEPARADEALAEVGTEHLADSAVHELSGGELQRVLLARALARDPDLLVLDEPGRGVDYAGQSGLYDLIARIRDRRGCGALIVSHDLHLVMAATDRVLCLNHHVCCAGRPETVTRHPEYLALFGPAAAGAFAVYTHAHDHGHDLVGAVVPLEPGAAEEDGRRPGREGRA